MEAAIYIDVLFFTNWGMNSFLLWCAGRLAGFRAGKARILLGGFVSALLYCLWLYFFRRNGGLLFSLLLMAAGIAAAYLPKRGKSLLRLFAAAWAVSFLMGGAAAALLTLTNAQTLFGHGLILRRNAELYPWQMLVWSVGMAYALLKLGGRWIESHIQRRREFCTVSVLWRGRRTEGRALIDTGNGLRQEDGRGVAVLEFAALQPLFTPEESVALLQGVREGIGLCSLPYTSLGNPDGRLWGVRAEQLEISFGETSVRHSDIFVGITFEAFTGAYEGLLPPCLLKEE